MSVDKEERNELRKRFGDKAVILIEDDLYNVKVLAPNARNRRLFAVHDEAVERLNATMLRHIDGNAQIYTTMVYKDVPREQLIKKFWNGLINVPEFVALPEELKNLELEQARKIGPTSRFTLERLYEGFIAHIDEESKVRNLSIGEYKEAKPYFVKWIVNACKRAIHRYPDDARKYLDNFYNMQAAFERLPKDKAGGDPYFIRTDRNIAGANANELYYKLVNKVTRNSSSEVYYTMYSRIQAKGNNIVKGLEAIADIPADPWLPEKNRVVQGDSRTWQFILKPISDIITQLPKLVSPEFMGWCDQEYKNDIMRNSMREFTGRYLFDSFDATEYDASTDPENFAMGIEILYEVCEGLGLKPDSIVDRALTIRHYLHDATLTPWGAYERDSTPSGHNFTGPNGTIVNMFRCFVQTKRLLNVSWEGYLQYLDECDAKGVALFGVVGDDAWQLRKLSSTAEEIAEENNSDGFKSNSDKIILSSKFIHFLQFGYYLDGDTSFFGYYPVSRVVEHGLFQERADQYTAESVSTQGLVQNINNARYNPCQDYLIEFFMEGDTKYRLGSKMGVMNLFRMAAGDRSVAQFLGREWDPSYADMSWEGYSEVLAGTISKIESMGRKFD